MVVKWCDVDSTLPKPILIMSEIRRKLVIVGDGACGKVCFYLVGAHTHFISPSDLSLDCLFQRHIPRGRLHNPRLFYIPHLSIPGLCPDGFWELCGRCRGGRQTRRARAVGYCRPGRLRPLTSSQLSWFPCHPYLLCGRLPGFPR